MQQPDNVIELKQLNQCAEGCAPTTRCSSALNQLCHSLDNAANARRFRQSPEKYCRQFGLAQTELEAVTDLDLIRLIEMGASTSCLSHLTAIYELKVETLGAEQTGLSESDFMERYRNGN